VTIDVCVVFTAQDEFQRDDDVIMPVECANSHDPHRHQTTYGALDRANGRSCDQSTCSTNLIARHRTDRRRPRLEVNQSTTSTDVGLSGENDALARVRGPSSRVSASATNRHLTDRGSKLTDDGRGLAFGHLEADSGVRAKVWYVYRLHEQCLKAPNSTSPTHQSNRLPQGD